MGLVSALHSKSHNSVNFSLIDTTKNHIVGHFMVFKICIDINQLVIIANKSGYEQFYKLSHYTLAPVHKYMRSRKLIFLDENVICTPLTKKRLS